MSEVRYMLDTSAILTLLEDEEGAERVETLLRGSDEVLLPFPVLMETYYISLRERSEDVADRRYVLLRQLPAIFLWSMDEPTLLTASRFKACYPLSLADAIIAAFAYLYGAILVHKDPEFGALAESVRQEVLPHKERGIG